MTVRSAEGPGADLEVGFRETERNYLASAELLAFCEDA